MDGSAKDFLKILEEADLRTQSKKRKYLKVSKKLELVDGKRIHCNTKTRCRSKCF